MTDEELRRAHAAGVVEGLRRAARMCEEAFASGRLAGIQGDEQAAHAWRIAASVFTHEADRLGRDP